jgi:hypothetical protein
MHPNYQTTFARFAAAASSLEPILSNRYRVPACALRDAREPDPMR